MNKDKQVLHRGRPVYTTPFMSEKDWWATKRGHWVKPKYFSRTKYKELRPLIVYMLGAFYVHPNNWEQIEDILEDNNHEQPQ